MLLLMCLHNEVIHFDPAHRQDDLTVEIGTSLGRYPDFPPTPEPFLSCPPLF